jgi:hypothetical protein
MQDRDESNAEGNIDTAAALLGRLNMIRSFRHKGLAKLGTRAIRRG